MSSLPDTNTLLTVYRLSPGFFVERVDANLYYVSSFQGNFVLKVYPYGTSLDGQRYQHWLLLALSARACSFAVPAPVRNHVGATFHTVENGSTWVLAPRLIGKHVQSNDPDQAYAAGSALAELHHALADIPPLPNPALPAYDFTLRTLPHSRGKLPAEPSDLGLRATKEARHRLRRFNEVARPFQESPVLPDSDLHWHIIHGDFAGSNLLYDGDRVVGVLDFELAHPDYRAREFADVLMRLASDMSSLFWGTSRAFVEGYHEKLALTRQEIDLIPYFIVAQQVDQVLEHFLNGQPVHAAQALRAQEEMSAWLESEQSRLLAMLRGSFLGE